MIITPESFWLCGRPQDILFQINELKKRYHTVREVIDFYIKK
jgi:hypothetical protein